MVKASWGQKRICPKCEAKFYDFSKEPIVCPSCQTQWTPEAAGLLKRNRIAPKSIPIRKEKENQETANSNSELEIVLDTDNQSPKEEAKASEETPKSK